MSGFERYWCGDRVSRLRARRGFSRSLLPVSTLAFAIGGAVDVVAQEGRAAAALEEIVVTATRREAGLQSVPASIAALTGAELEKQGITSFREVSESISGLTLDFPNYAINAAIYMRGVGTTGPTAVQSVSTMIDGVYQIRQGLAFTELMDIERIEVLRGPQGTLFGKNSTSGAIRIFTRDPDVDMFSGKVEGVVGNLDANELRGIVNIPIIEGKLAARISGYTSERDGFTDNALLGEDTQRYDREGWRAKLLWNVTEDFQVKLTADNHEQTGTFDRGITRYSPDALQNAAILGVDLPPVTIGNAKEDILGQKAEEVERYILNLQWDFAGHTLTTISSWEDNQTFLFYDRDETAAPGDVVFVHPVFGPITAPSTENTGVLDVETHEIQLASNFDSPLSYLLGVYIQKQDTDSITAIPPVFTGTSTIKVDSQAVFGNVTYEFNDQWSASLGLRYDEDERTGSNATVGPNHIETFRETTYSAKLTYQYDADRMFYFSHDKGFKSGTVNRELSTCASGGACLDPDQALVDPEIAHNYEVGMKSEWLDNRLRLNGAIFYTEFEDFQVTQDIPEAATIIGVNAAEVEAKGIEAEFNGVVTDNFIVNGSVTWVQSEYTEYEDAPCAFLTPCTNGSQDFSGETLDHAPKLSFNLGAEYRNSLGGANGAEWFARADVIYKDDHNLFVLLADETEEKAYALVNARLGLESQGEWKLTLWSKNLFDEEYRNASRTDTLGGLSEILGEPRTYGVTADWHF